MQKYLLGIDRGTTNVKAALYRHDGTEIAVSSQSCARVESPIEGYAEQNMEQIWKDTVKAIRGLWEKGYSPKRVEGVGVSGQGGGMFLVDQSGMPVREGIVSLDRRVACAARRWKEEGTHQQFLKLWSDGNPTIPQALLYWMKEYEEDNYRKIRWILQCKDWIRYKLTGMIQYEITDASNGALISETGEYDFANFEDYGIEEAKEKFPELIAPWDLAGTITETAAKETGLLAGTKVAGGGHDVAMMALGNGCGRAGQLVSVLGTWGLNLLIVEQPHKMMKHYAKIILSAVPGKYLLMNGGSTGASLEWMIDRFCRDEKKQAEEKGIHVFDEIHDKIMKGENESRSSVVCHPFTEPLLMMPGYEHAQAGIYGMTERTTRGQILRAILEGIALEIAMFLEVSKKADTSLDTIYLSGGGARNSLLASLIADAANMKVKIMSIEEPGCRGAALSAGIAAGVFKEHSEIAVLPMEVKSEIYPSQEGTGYMKEKMRKFKYTAKMMETVWNSEKMEDV